MVVIGMVIAGGWALIASVVDIVKEWPSGAWLSVAAAATATAGIAVPVLVVLGRIPADG